MTYAPIVWRWDGEAMIPLSRFARRADETFVVGECYQLEPIDEVSQKSRGHYFAVLKECWQNLPENLADQFPTVEALRKKCLIKAGFRDERSIVTLTNSEAQRVAAFIKPLDDCSIVLVKNNVVLQYTAKSQSQKAMGRKEFQASKDGVFRILNELVGLPSGALEREAGQAA